MRSDSRSTERHGIVRLGVGSAPALLASTAVFCALIGDGYAPARATTAAFLAGVISNAMNRQWSWAIRSRRALGSHLALSLCALVAACLATTAMTEWVKRNVEPHIAMRVALITAVFLVIQAAFFLVKFVTFERLPATVSNSGS